MKASKALIRKFPIYHLGDSCHFRQNRIGHLVPINIDQHLIDLDPEQNVTWANADFDQNDDQFNNIGALWNNADLSRPPQGIELQSPAYQHTLVNKARCPGPAALLDQIGQHLYNQLNTFAMEQGGLPFGIGPLLEEHEGEICVFPGNWVKNYLVVIQPHFFDKQVVKFGGNLRFWDDTKAGSTTMLQRAQSMIQEAVNVRQQIRSPGYAARKKTDDSGMHAYATSNWFHGAEFWFCHKDRHHIHLMRAEREHCNSAMSQTLNTRDVERAQAVGLDVINNPDHTHLITFDFPIPSSSATHISWGPASSPILGCIATVSKSSFRPTTSPIQFRFANDPTPEEKASRPTKKFRSSLSQLKKSLGRKNNAV